MPKDQKNISTSEHETQHSSESLGINTDSAVQDFEKQAQQSLSDAKTMAEDFIARAKTENFVSVDTEKEIKEMQALKVAIKKLNDDFVGRLLKIILRPVELFREHQKSKTKKLLKIQDNLVATENSPDVPEKSSVPADKPIEMVLDDKDLPLENIDQNIVNKEVEISDWDKFLSDKSEIVIGKLQQFSEYESEQKFVISTWGIKPEIKKIISESEKPLEQIRVLMDFPAVVFNKNSDLNFLATIAKKFDASARQTLLEKISPCFDTARKNNKEIGWDIVYGILVLASFPEVKKEELGALPLKKLQGLTAAIVAYGESAIQKLWTDENVEGFTKNVYGRDDLTNAQELIDFANDLSPTLKRHLPIKSGSDHGSGETKSGQTIWSKGGLRGPIYFLNNFIETISRIPEQLREPFFASLKPQDGELSWPSKDSEIVFVAKIQNFIAYSQECGDDSKFSFDDFTNIIDFFSLERYPAVKNGFEFFKLVGLEHKIRNKFRVFELAGGPQGEVGNTLVQSFLSKEDSFVYDRNFPRRHYGGGSDVRRAERSESSIERLYAFSSFCKNELADDTELCLQFLDIDEKDSKIILAFLAGQLPKEEKNYPDISLIEGEMVEMGRKFANEGRGERNQITIFPNFKKFDRQQKEDFLFLYNFVPDQHYDLSPIFSSVESGSVKKIRELITITGAHFADNKFSIGTLEKMATRPECGGLFNFASSDQTVDKLIELYDAGLPSDYFIYGRYVETTYGDTPKFEKMLLRWDTAKLVDVARQAKLINPEISLGSIVLFDHPEYEVKDIILCIRHGVVKYGDSKHIFDEEIDENKLIIFETRIQETKQLIGDSFGVDQFHWRDILVHLPPDIWNKIKTNTAWFKNCLVHGFYSKDIINHSPDILDEPLFWEIDWKENNEDILRQLFIVAKNMRLVGFNLSEFRKNNDPSIPSVWAEVQSLPWLFTLENLTILKTAGITESQFHLLHDITLEEFSIFKNYAAILEIGSFYWWLKGLRENTLISLDELRELQKFSSDIIPWNIQKIIQGRRNPDENIVDALYRLETQIEPEEVRIWHEGENKHLNEWRARGVLKEMGSQAPKFVSWICEKNFSLKFYEQVSRQPVAIWNNLDRVTVAFQETFTSFDMAEAEKLFSILSHSNIEIALSLLDTNVYNFCSILNLSPEKLTSFLDSLTPEIVKQFLEISSVVNLESRDMVDFFTDPNLAGKIINFNNSLRTIFGKEFKDNKLSVYDLLVMDFETDLRNLQELQSTCFNTLTVDIIKALILVSEGSRLVTLQKVLLLFNERRTVDFSDAAEQLEKLPEGLRLAVIREKGAINFGWGVLRYRDQLAGLGLEESEINSLIIKLYTNRRDELNELDYSTAKVLIEDKSLQNNATLFLDIIGKYSGDVSVFILEILSQRPVDEVRAIKIFENLYAAKLLEIKYFDAVSDIMNNMVSSQENGQKLSERFAKIISSFALKNDGVEQKDKQVDEVEISDRNWLPLFITYISLDVNNNLKSEEKEKILALFKKDKTKDFCLNAIQQLWNNYLQTDEPNKFPFKLSMIAEHINNYGAGPLSQLEALGKFIYTFSKKLISKNITPEILQKIVGGEISIEERFKKGRWNQEDQSGYFQTSSDMLKADAGLLADFFDLFENFNLNQFKQYLREIYPLYRAQLALLENSSQQYSLDGLNSLKKSVKESEPDFKERGANFFTEKKTILIDEIKKIFKEKFGIIKVPEDFSEDATHTLTNFSVYLGNFHSRTTDKETTLGFYLALMLNGQWNNFRRGEEINPDIYLVPEKSAVMKEMLSKRKELTPITSENLDISVDEMSRFRSILQQEAQNVVLGEVETIDIKLTNVLINLQSLSDLDLYPEQMDKARLNILLKYGNKRVGGTVAKMYLEQKNPGKPMQYKEDELVVMEELRQIMEENGLVLSPEVIKQHFQDAMKPFSSVVNILNFAGESGANQEVEKIQKLLVPSPEIVAIFNRFGEEFQVTSGAIAVAQDLNYLDNLIVKHSDDLVPEEKTLLTDYIKQIREQLIKLDGIYELVKNKFAPLKQSSHEGSNQLFKVKLAEIDRIINSQSTARTVTSTATNSLNSIIENIRECLSCKNAGCNNDTNLSFGDENKFFVYSQTEEKKDGSIADQIVFVEPVTYEDKTTGLAFVFDRVYGTNTPDLFINHIKTVLKKYRQLKDAFPDCNLSMVIPDSIISTGGVSVERLEEKLSAGVSKKIEVSHGSVAVSVVSSATGDHYIEFGGGARTAGERQISGVVLRIK